MSESKRCRLEIMRSELENERSSFISHWRDIGDFLLPRRPRFSLSDTNRGDRRNHKIIDSTGTIALRTLRAGMMSGVTSPARPWFRLTTPDPDLAEFGPVKEWLYTVDRRMATTFLRSNLYNALPIVYGDIGAFGTSALYVEEDFDSVVRFYPFPVGSYMLANNERMKVDVFFREFRLTVRQLVGKFGKKDASGKVVDWSNFSRHVQDLYKKGNLEVWIDVCHVIEPNAEYDEKKLHSKFKKYASTYYEKGIAGSSYAKDDDIVLSEKGYDFFPVFAPRWETNAEDVYATNCPGMDALGDIKALQMMQKRKAQAIEKMVNPPMTGPSALRSQKASILPGDLTFVDTQGQNQGFRPAHEVNPRVQELLMDIQATQGMVQRVFYEDLFLMLAQSDRREITAREIDERHEEKLLALGPVLEQLNQDLLDPLIDITFEKMVAQGALPPPPEELQGMKLKVEYVSVMAQAQKLAGIANIERFAGFTMQAASVNPEILDKIDTDQMIDIYADITSVPPGIVRTDEAVAEIRGQRQQMQQAQQAAMVAKDAASATQRLGKTPMDQNSMLTQLLGAAQQGQLAQTNVEAEV
jgi:hypothetical protein